MLCVQVQLLSAVPLARHWHSSAAGVLPAAVELHCAACNAGWRAEPEEPELLVPCKGNLWGILALADFPPFSHWDLH